MRTHIEPHIDNDMDYCSRKHFINRNNWNLRNTHVVSFTTCHLVQVTKWKLKKMQFDDEVVIVQKYDVFLTLVFYMWC